MQWWPMPPISTSSKPWAMRSASSPTKHCSLHILPEHYPIVGECLMEAIGQILGDALTPEIADAWGAAYQQLADLLIQAEEHLYRTQESRTGGWRGERRFRIERMEKESEVITSFYLQPCTGEAVIDFTPGQYVGLILEIDGQKVRRNYSLSDAPGKQGLRISVKREAEGLVSGYLHNRARVGDEVTLTAPSGDFVLPTELRRPLVFVTGGVGITPAISMLNSCVDSGHPITFIHAAIDGRHHAFKEHLEALSRQHSNLRSRVVYEKPLQEDRPDKSGFIDQAFLEAQLPENRDVELYFLGPKPFMACVNRICDDLNIPPAQRHYEFFGPAEALDSAAA